MVEINSEVKKIIEENPLAFATVDEAGKPNVIGVAFVKVVSRNQVLITDNYMKKTKENLEKNNNVCLAGWDKDWNGYKLVGTAEYFTSGKWKKFVEKMPENKSLPAKGAILVAISELIKLK
jgi:predicted pyridoxine 5'-phosphate oxidase superfamily flavin-nucleotide-binding protein